MSSFDKQSKEAIRQAEQLLHQRVEQETPKHPVPEWYAEYYEDKPIEFTIEILAFTPTVYQRELLRDISKRIVVIWPRQSGKSTTLAARMIWYAATHDRTLSLIVAPGLRQSMILMDRIQSFLMAIPRPTKRELVARMQRTVVWFKNGSQIVALPNSPNLLRGYTAHQVLCDESAFFRDDELVFFSVLFPMLQTTNGTLIVSSTPWGKDSAFYRFSQNPNFSKHKITYKHVVEAKLTTNEFIEEMRREIPPERFRREFEADFVEDELAYFPQDLITQCIDSELQPLADDWTKTIEAEPGRYFVGVDFGKHVDYSAIVVGRRDGDQVKLVSVIRFPLETPYASVIGYVKLICDKLRSVEKVLCDQSGVGEYIVEDMKKAGIRSTIEGVILTLPTKQEILGYLKQLMQNRLLSIYYDADLVAEINVERFELTKTGQIQFSHPEGTHDDRLFALALAGYASRQPSRPQFKPVTRSF